MLSPAQIAGTSGQSGLKQLRACRYACKTIPKIPKRGQSTPRYLLKLQTEVDAMQQLGPSFDAVSLKVGPRRTRSPQLQCSATWAPALLSSPEPALPAMWPLLRVVLVPLTDSAWSSGEPQTWPRVPPPCTCAFCCAGLISGGDMV